MSKRGKRVFTRICQRCGTQWTLPRALATETPPTMRQLTAIHRMSRFSLGGAKSRVKMQTSVFQTDSDRITRNATCPNCGHQEYVQYRPRAKNIPEPPRGMPPELVKELQRLALLRDTDQLSEKEYDEQRADVLNRDRTAD